MNIVTHNMFKMICFLGLFLSMQASVFAQEAKVNKIYLDTIKEYSKVTNFAENAAEVAAGKFRVDLQNDPNYSSIVTDEFISDIQQFFYEIFISDDTVTKLATIYSAYFSIDEMIELIRFSKSELGEKMVKVGPALMVKTQQLGLDLVKEHEKEFIQVLSEHIKRVHRGGDE
jgi:hypothetical protein